MHQLIADSPYSDVRKDRCQRVSQPTGFLFPNFFMGESIMTFTHESHVICGYNKMQKK